MQDLFYYTFENVTKNTIKLTKNFIVFRDKPTNESLFKCLQKVGIIFKDIENFNLECLSKIEDNIFLLLPNVMSHSVKLELLDLKEVEKRTGLTLIPEGHIRLTMISALSGLKHTMDLPVTQEQLIFYYLNDVLLQDAFPNLTKEHREFIKTGIIPEEIKLYHESMN